MKIQLIPRTPEERFSSAIREEMEVMKELTEDRLNHPVFGSWTRNNAAAERNRFNRRIRHCVVASLTLKAEPEKTYAVPGSHIAKELGYE